MSILDTEKTLTRLQESFAGFVEKSGRKKLFFFTQSVRLVKINIAETGISKRRTQLHTDAMALQVCIQMINV